MNGACQTPSSSRTCGSVGGALRRRAKRVSVVCGATVGAAAAANAAHATNVNPARLLTRTGIHQGERDVGEKRAEREEDRSRSGAAGDEVHVARAQRVEHQPSKTWPGGNHFDRER